jgi:hypothetical protein
MIRPALLSALVLLAGCARSEEARYAQVNNTSLPALNTSDPGEEDELTVGTWQTGLEGDQPVLEFGPVGATSLFSLACDDRRNLLLQRHGAVLSGDLPNMLVQVGSETRRFSVTNAGGTNPVLRGTLAANDPFRPVLLNNTTARIIVRLGDAQPLVMPPSPLLAAYAQQCANGEARGGFPAGNNVEANGSVEVVAGNASAGNSANAN